MSLLAYGSEFRVLEYSKEKNLVAIEVRENIESYKVGQDLKQGHGPYFKINKKNLS